MNSSSTPPPTDDEQVRIPASKLYKVSVRRVTSTKELRGPARFDCEITPWPLVRRDLVMTSFEALNGVIERVRSMERRLIEVGQYLGYTLYVDLSTGFERDLVICLMELDAKGALVAPGTSGPDIVPLPQNRKDAEDAIRTFR